MQNEKPTYVLVDPEDIARYKTALSTVRDTVIAFTQYDQSVTHEQYIAAIASDAGVDERFAEMAIRAVVAGSTERLEARRSTTH